LAGHEATLALARLLSERELRLRFALDPARITRELHLSPEDSAILLAMDPVALSSQAQSLIDKRRGEVARLAPRTWQRLGGSGARLFEDYASGCWPTGHLRHPQDAVSFLGFLSRTGQPHDPIEALMLETRLSDRRRRIRVVRNVSRWRLPALYCAWRTRHGWRERLLSIGPVIKGIG
jgi:hypothetical protein